MNSEDVKLKDYYDQYAPFVHRDLMDLCTTENGGAVSLNFIDIRDNLNVHHGVATICDVFLLTNKNLFGDATLERTINDLYDSLKSLICNNQIWISTADKIKNYYTNPRYNGMPFCDRPIDFVGLYGQYLVDKYGQIFYYSLINESVPPQSYNYPIFRNDIIGAVRYCVGLEFDKLLEKLFDFMNKNN